MALLNRFSSFLDRFDEQLVVNGERVKHELNQWIDQRVILVRNEVRMIKSRFGGARPVNGQRGGNEKGFDDEPLVVTVSFEEFMEQQANLHDGDAVDRNQPSTSTGSKRKPANQIGNKQKKMRSDVPGGSKYTCKFQGCGKSFPLDSKLVVHERIHLAIKPFSCTWPDCVYSSESRPNVVVHIRTKHFKLPITRKEQGRLNIVDNRDPEQFVQVDNQLVQRRL